MTTVKTAAPPQSPGQVATSNGTKQAARTPGPAGRTSLAAITELFPLVARPRPHTGALTRRIDAVDKAAREALETPDPAEAIITATRALNRAVVIAQDCGAHDLARKLCETHLSTYLKPARRLSAPDAARMLGPAVALARLQGAEHGPDQVVARLRVLLHAVHGLGPVRIGQVRLPLGNVAATAEERRVLVQQVRTHLLVSGITAHSEVRAWAGAADLARTYDGHNPRLLEARQALIVDRIVSGDMPAACRLIEASQPRQEWERQVLACLSVLCTPAAQRGAAIHAVLDRYSTPVQNDDGSAWYGLRLGLVVASIACLTPEEEVRKAGEDVARQVVASACEVSDGHSARDVLRHPLVRVATGTEQVSLARVVARSGLAGGALVGRTRTRLLDAAAHARTVLGKVS